MTRKLQLRRAAAIRPVARDAQAVALDSDLEVLAFHAGQFHLDDETGAGGINVRVRNPAPGGVAIARADGRAARDEMNRRTDFGYGHGLKNYRKKSRRKRSGLP
jgi:hypothetical protein